MRKKRSIAKSRAASLKVHRTIARMKEARLQHDIASEFVDLIHAEEIHLQMGDPKTSRPTYILRAGLIALYMLVGLIFGLPVPAMSGLHG
jgi:hypothetical protein